ncbi:MULTISPECIES: hypothetical protein [Streptomyces]|uniref:hypothetical protein n=1 Tax=Streptomyces TaxID=1883 RepID=UPI0019656D93|nr:MULTISPECIES: hypothetical protein [Streptomyces]QRX96288.1 hypothetical protein JNO44_40770 [Streptomyces noursei]UJB44958.1 hypothetical protein HRD51_32960 [Streptomyces sp. A1-5]
MRKLHQIALVAAAAGGLSTIGASASHADAPVGYSGPPTATQPDAPQADAWTASGATSHTYGSHGGPQQAGPQQAAAPQPLVPQGGPDVSPQLNPQLNPQLSPQVAQLLPQSGPHDQNNAFRPYQECSPQSLLDANVPIGLLATPETRGFNCAQNNAQANAHATAR